MGDAERGKYDLRGGHLEAFYVLSQLVLSAVFETVLPAAQFMREAIHVHLLFLL
jgi:hypothetical protein